MLTPLRLLLLLLLLLLPPPNTLICRDSEPQVPGRAGRNDGVGGAAAAAAAQGRPAAGLVGLAATWRPVRRHGCRGSNRQGCSGGSSWAAASGRAASGRAAARGGWGGAWAVDARRRGGGAATPAACIGSGDAAARLQGRLPPGKGNEPIGSGSGSRRIKPVTCSRAGSSRHPPRDCRRRHRGCAAALAAV